MENEFLNKFLGSIASVVNANKKVAKDSPSALDKMLGAIAKRVNVVSETGQSAISEAEVIAKKTIAGYSKKQKEKQKRVLEGIQEDLKALGPIRGDIVSGASYAFDVMTGKNTLKLAHALMKGRNRLAEEYPLIDFPYNYLKSEYQWVKKIGSTTAADGSILTADKKGAKFIADQDIWGISDYIGSLFDVREEGAPSNVFTVLGAVNGGPGDWVTSTIDGLMTVAADPNQTIEHLTGFAADIEHALPAMIEAVGQDWQKTWEEGTPEDKIRFCSYALTEITSWFVGVGEVKAAAASAQAANKVDDVGRWSNWSKYFSQADDAGRWAGLGNQVDDASRYLSAFSDELGRLTIQNIDDTVKQIGRIGKESVSWLDDAARNAGKIGYDDLSRWVRQSLNEAGENFKRLFEPQMETAGGGQIRKSEADDLFSGNGGGVRFHGPVEPQEIHKIADGAGKIFATPDDPIRDILGRGMDSHPEEWNKIIKELQDAGCEIIYREGTMAYGPLRKGTPGVLVIDPNASMSALKHEYNHFLESKYKGYPSAAEAYQDWQGRIAEEWKSYSIEIEEAEKLGLDDVVEQLKKNFEIEKQDIISRYGPIDE